MSDSTPQNKQYRPSLICFLIARISMASANQLIAIAIGWQIYELTQSAFYLGLVGLMQFIPLILLTLFAGYAADRYNRKMIIGIAYAIQICNFFLLAYSSDQGTVTPHMLLFAAFLAGAANSMGGPSMQSLLPNIVPTEIFPKAAAWNASGFQVATILGPAMGGILYVWGAHVVYATAGCVMVVALGAMMILKVGERQIHREPVTLKTMLAGISFIKSRPVILGAISLDLFAVLFGGATALLPIYASTILHVGSEGLGMLRAAPAVGALLVSFVLAKKPIERKVGIRMFTAVIFFGAATIVFALSKSFALSAIALFILGGCDVISVVIRSTLVQLQTPDEMRGRVSSVNQIFIGTSNQLGEFESGVTAAWFGTVPAAIIGGCGTVIIVLLWMKLFPELRKKDRFLN
ncbi:MAG: MFS transporter [Anaerofustis sp.]